MGVERQYELRRRIEDLLSEVSQVRAELRAERVEADSGAGRHAATSPPRLRLIRGGKALVLAPVMWVWAQVREHATAATGIAAAGVIGSASTLGVAAAPEVAYNPPPRSTTTAVAEQPELRSTSSSAVMPRPSQVPTPALTETAEAVESETTPPESPAPASVPTPTPTPTPVEGATASVAEVVWTRTAALVHCRDVLEVPPAGLQDCVQELLAG